MKSSAKRRNSAWWCGQLNFKVATKENCDKGCNSSGFTYIGLSEVLYVFRNIVSVCFAKIPTKSRSLPQEILTLFRFCFFLLKKKGDALN